MERLTERIDGIVVSRERHDKYSPCHHCKYQSTDECLEDECTYGSVLNKLAAYEDLDKEGRLIKLPCKVGDTLYVPCVNSVMETIVDCIQLKVGVVIFTKNVNKHGYENHHWFRESDIGKTVFLTREEAEKALKGAENE
nr:MAG TPA: hypothetical protein [Caudoviricetes sp.]